MLEFHVNRDETLRAVTKFSAQNFFAVKRLKEKMRVFLGEKSMHGNAKLENLKPSGLYQRAYQEFDKNRFYSTWM